MVGAVKRDDDNNIFDSAAEFMLRGLPAAVVSSGVGFANTAIALTNSFGADIDQIDEEDAISRSLGHETGDYYSDHKVGIDVVGLVAGSIIPGVGAMRGLRAFQKSARAAGSLKIGLGRALLPVDKAADIAKSIKSDGILNAMAELNNSKLGLIASGFHQQALEAAAFEGAVLLTMNQNASLTPEDLEYFEGIGHNMGHAAFGLVLGTGFGGTFEAFANWGKAKGVITSKFYKNIKDLKIETEGVVRGFVAGDAILPELKSYYEAKRMLNMTRVGPLADDVVGRLEDVTLKQKNSKDLVQKKLLSITGSTDEAGQIFAKLDQMDNIEQAAPFLSGVGEFRPVYAKDLLEEPPSSDIIHTTRANAKKWMQSMFKKNNIDEPFEGYFDAVVEGNKGFMYEHDHFANQSGIRGFVFTDETYDWDDITTWRHETGHSLANMIAARFSKGNIISNPIKNTKIGRALVAEMEALSRTARPGAWRLADEYKQILDAGDTGVYDADNLKRMQQHVNYMNGGDELIADSYAILSSTQALESLGMTAKEAKKQFPTVYNLMVANNTLAKEFTRGRQLLSLRDMRLYDTSLTPTAADLGKEGVELIGDTVKWAKNSTSKIDRAFEKEFLQMSWDEASALNSIAAVRKDISPGMAVDWRDIPRLTAAKIQGIEVKVMRDGVDHTFIDEMGELSSDYFIDMHLLRAKAEVGKELLKKSAKARASAKQFGSIGKANFAEGAMSHSEIARIIDIDPAGMENFTGLIDRFTRNADAKEVFDFVSERLGDMFWSANPVIDSTKKQFTQVIADRRSVVEGARLAGVEDAMMRTKIHRQMNDNIVAAFFKGDAATFPKAAHMQGTNYADKISGVDQTSTVLSSANASPMSGQVDPQFIGRLGNKVVTIKHEESSNLLKGDIIKLATDEDAIYEANVLDSILRQRIEGDEFQFVPENLEDVVEEMGSIAEKVIPENFDIVNSSNLADKLFRKQNQIWAGSLRKQVHNLLTTQMDEVDLLRVVDELATKTDPNLHQIVSNDLARFWRKKVQYNGDEIVYHKNMINVASGGIANLNPRALYPGTPDSSRYPFFAMVVAPEEGVMGVRSVGMVTGHSRDSLAENIKSVRKAYGDKVKIVTKTDIKTRKQLLKEYEVERLFGDTHMDAAMKRKGTAWDVAPQANPEIFPQYLSSIHRQQSALVRNVLELKYSEELGALKNYSAYIEDLNSTFGKKPFSRNIYQDVENMMLNKRPDDYDSIWNKMNTITEGAISKAYYAVSGGARQAMTTGDWEKMNGILERYGMGPKGGMFSPANPVLLNKVEAPKPVLGKLVSQLNFALGTSMLRMDFAHSLTNVVSLPVMMTSELGALRRAVSEDTWKILRDGTSVPIPGSTARMPTNTHMSMQAIKNFFTKPDLVEEYRKRGIINSLLEDIQTAQADFATIPTLSDPNKISEAAIGLVNAMSKPTDYSEQFVKFVAANVADQFTTAAKVNPDLKWSAINNFVTRVHGNYLASQRPTLFQGWMGQTVGLFQTYQFNLLQSLFQNVSKGNKATVVNMIAAQAGIFGAQSVPGFHLLNRYIGERSQENNDFYSVTGDMLGEDLSNWFMYGTASSAAVPIIGNGIDLYSRGDLTPRTPILIPTSPTEVPLVSITANAYNAMLNAVSKLKDGAPVAGTMLDALGHNGFNRPLQGLGQLLSGDRTTNSGKLLARYQTWDMWNIATKLMGTKALDEAVAVSSYYRTAAYSSYRQQELNDLGESFRQEVRSTGAVNSETYKQFMTQYTERGGRIDNFSRWVNNNTEGASVSVINTLRNNNNSPEGRYMQTVMGADILDYTTDFR